MMIRNEKPEDYRAGMKSLMLLFLKWRRAINIHRNCFTFIPDQMYCDEL